MTSQYFGLPSNLLDFQYTRFAKKVIAALEAS